MGAAASVPALHLPTEEERVHRVKCNCCSRDIVGTRWKEKNNDFNLCDVCYTQRDGVVDNSAMVPVFVAARGISKSLLSSNKLTPRHISMVPESCDPLLNRMTYSSIMNALPEQVVERERKNKLELLSNCPDFVSADFHKHLGLFPAYTFPHGVDDILLDLTEGGEWILYREGEKLKYFLEMSIDILGTMNMLVLERSYGNLAKLSILIGLCFPQHETPPWVKLFAARWLQMLQHEEASLKQITATAADEFSRRQYFSHRCIPLNFEMKNIPGGLRNFVLPGFMAVHFTDIAKNQAKGFYDSCSVDVTRPWFPSSILANCEAAARLEQASPLLGQTELTCRFDINFPNAKKFVQLIQPLIGARGFDIQTAVSYDVIATAKLVKFYVDELMNSGLKRLKRVSPLLRLRKAVIMDSAKLLEMGRRKWKESKGNEGILNITDTVQYTIELVSFDLSLRMHDVLVQKIFKNHLHLKTEVDMSSNLANNVAITFGVRLKEIASKFPFFQMGGIVDTIAADHFMCVKVVILQKDLVIMDKYLNLLKELSQSSFIKPASTILDLGDHLNEIGYSGEIENRKTYFDRLSRKSSTADKLHRRLFRSFSSGSSSGKGETGLTGDQLTSVKEESN